MENLGNVYICGSPLVMSRTDAQYGLDMVFQVLKLKANFIGKIACTCNMIELSTIKYTSFTLTSSHNNVLFYKLSNYIVTAGLD
jgi:hypothetical protein